MVGREAYLYCLCLLLGSPSCSRLLGAGHVGGDRHLSRENLLFRYHTQVSLSLLQMVEYPVWSSSLAVPPPPRVGQLLCPSGAELHHCIPQSLAALSLLSGPRAVPFSYSEERPVGRR